MMELDVPLSVTVKRPKGLGEKGLKAFKKS